MIVPEHWLRSFCDPSLTTEKLAHLLTMSGLEVESIAAAAPAFRGVVVGEILEVARHPNADKLTLCTVRAGRERLRVVCGAPNVRKGMKVPVARVGAELPGMSVSAASVRGVESLGMLCSARELGLSEDHTGLLELPASARPGTDVRKLLELDERILTLKLTPNRADCLSMLGVAREVSALTGTALRLPALKPVRAQSHARHAVRITHPQGCGRFAGRVLRNVNAAAPTPEWMRRRLERAGQRSISALVDVTNYVMLELGRPLHVYDLDKLSGPIDVRWGRPGEKVLLLNGQEVALDDSVLCITDDSGPIGLAGIMGGESTKAEPSSRHIFLESAFFFPEAVAGRARRYNFTSDAAHRFERGVDFGNNVEGIERATRLILDICGGDPGPTVDQVRRLPRRKPVRMRVTRAQKVIGMPVSEKEMAQAFARLRLPARRAKGAFSVTPPSYRFDLQIEEDLIEEVARLHGFDRIPAHPPRARAVMAAVPEARRSLHALRERLAACDFQEVVNFSFVEPAWESDLCGGPDPIRLLNPIASQQSVMRTSLLGGLIANVRYNLARKLERVRVFEVGRVYLRDSGQPDAPLEVGGVRQPVRIAAAAFGPAWEDQWGMPGRPVDLFDLKADLDALAAPLKLRYEAAEHPALHPGRSARVHLGDQAIGWIGELHPRWQQKYELPQSVAMFEAEAAALQQCPLPAPRVPSKYPPAARDIALLVNTDITADALLAVAMAEMPIIVQSIRLFDLYQGSNLPAGKKSLAFRVVMQDTERTLTDAEADSARDALVALWGRRFGATPRV
ncbi:MAG: phenylalanine--tRNA ligase subunit beta [Betaproteobacteria bacterium]|nr:phenylalanine--tRNA ligase subunit beta [Betaproteobacteria bacterium]